MAYTINLTSSPSLITINDDTVNKTYAVTFVGRNRPEWGEIVNENFLRLLENFAGASPPPTSVTGQLFFDTVTNGGLLKVYDGNKYVSLTDGGTF